MEHWFDDLARALAARRSRRAALRLAASTAAAAVLAQLDPRRAFAQPVSDCVTFCNTLPPGPARGACNADCGQTRGSGGLFQQCGADPSRLCVAGSGTVTCCRADQVCVNGVCQCPPTLPDECNGKCVALAADFQNCGTCGNACHSSFKACFNGQCVCPFGHTLCGGVCRFDFTSDPQNCGACGNVCPASAPNCCNGSCVSFQTDPENCGGCFLLCPPRQSCVNGTCKLVCPSGQAECLPSGAVDPICCPPETPTCCGELCVDLKTNRFACGSCGTTCPLGQDCVNGVCQKVCPTGQVACGNVCVNPLTDRNNCGTCGTSCGTGFCINGVCKGCSDGRDRCGGNCCVSHATCCNDTCVDLQTDPLHCGACFEPGRETCLSVDLGGGGPDCHLECCGGICINNCTDRNNCGGCGVVCPSGQFCCGGRCCGGICIFDVCI